MKEGKKKALTTEEKLQKIRKEYEEKLKKVKQDEKRKEDIEKRKRWRGFLALLTMLSQAEENVFDLLSLEEESQNIVAGFLLSQDEAWFSGLAEKGKVFLEPLREEEAMGKKKKKELQKKLKGRKKEVEDVNDE